VVDLAGSFRAQAERVGASVHHAARPDLHDLVARVLRDAGCRTVALAGVVPDAATLAERLTGAGLSIVAPEALRPTRRADAGISVARLGIAETGSALLASTPGDRRVELCVDVHLVLLDAATLVPTLDPAFAVLRELSARPRAYATLVSGPSRSADIERQLTIGVHGPRALHVVLLEPGP
jgi:L-lactate dehydrogenase complex protein LldG